MHLQDDDFALLGLERCFSIDLAALDAQWKALQRQVHPDKFAAEGAAAQRVALQWSVRINEAYQRLKNPLQRAQYLCELYGVPVEAHSNTRMPAEFLVQQMQWREVLDDADSASDLTDLHTQVQVAQERYMAQIVQLLDCPSSAAASEAVHSVRALLFVEKFRHSVQQRMQTLPQ